MRIDALKEFGLNEKEAKIYLALLELGEAKAYEIAHKTRIARPTVYDVLDKLITEGLVGSYDKHKIRHYIASDPEKIKRNLISKQTAFENLLPELKSVYNKLQAKPKVSFYEGVEGIKTVFEETIAAKNKQLKGILSVHDLFEVPGKKYMNDYVTRRIKLGYPLRVIRSKTKEIAETWPTSERELRQLRYTPESMIFTMTIYLYDNKVGLISSVKENFGMVIESLEYSQAMNHLFEALLQISKPT